MPHRRFITRAAALALAAGSLSLASAASAQPVPARPVMAEDPPPPVMVAREAPTIRAPQPPFTVAVRIMGGASVLWAGDVALDNIQGAQMNMSLQQADALCPSDAERRIGRRQTGLNFSLRPSYRRTGNEPLTVTVTWTRASADCALPGTRTIGIDTEVTLDPGTTRVVEGDSGLRIELTRKK
jgi:hypothetical protein